jgi:hypothetical protein
MTFPDRTAAKVRPWQDDVSRFIVLIERTMRRFQLSRRA